MSKDPAILFYTADFLTGTMTMTNEHIGMYIRLLCLQHQKRRLTEQDMLYICTTYVEDVYKKFTKDPDGLYYNERMEEEVIKRKKYSESRRKNINNRYNRNASKDKSKSTYVVHMENENENINRDINKRKEKNVRSTQSLNDFFSSLKQQEVYKTIDLDTELNKMKAWILTRPKRKLTKRFAVNWLNRALDNVVTFEEEEKKPIIIKPEPIPIRPEISEEDKKRVRELIEKTLKKKEVA